MRLLPETAARLRWSAMPVVVTGAGGWLGRAALELLDVALGDALPARVKVFATAPGSLMLQSGRRVATTAYGALAQEVLPNALILHFAFLTRGQGAAPDFIAVNRAISQVMQNFVARNGAAGIFIPSSGAAYDAHDSYGALKREDEAAFSALAAKIGFAAAMPRIFNLAGPFMNNLDGYALGSIITAILRGAPVVLRAAHPVVRSYAHIEDVLNIALAILVGRFDVPMFDTAGETAVEISTLATRAGQLLTGQDVTIARPPWRDGVPDHYVGNAASFQRVAALTGVKLRALDEQILDTADYIGMRRQAVLF